MTSRIEFRKGGEEDRKRPGQHVGAAELAHLEGVFQQHITGHKPVSPTEKPRCHIISCVFEGDALVCYYHCT